MKKILIFLIVLGAITFINIDLFANTTYQGITLDTQLSDLNNYTLRQVFENNNEFNNGSFNNNLNGWNVQTGNQDIDVSVVNGELQIISLNPNPGSLYIYQFINFTANNNYYIRLDYDINDGTLTQWLFDGWISVGREFLLSSLPLGSGEYSKIFTPLNTGTDGYFIGLTASDIFDVIKLDNFYMIDLTTLGINLTQGQLDYYYDLYWALYNNIDLTVFYNTGYDNGYDEGLFDYHTGNYYGQYDYTLSEPYDQATQANISLLSVFSLIIGVVMSMLGFIINIEMFGISIASVLGTLAIGVSIIWLLKLIRG